jgi:hypothetical protein
MSGLQNLTNTNTPKEGEAQIVASPDEELLKINQQKWIDFCGVGGLITDSDGTLKPMTISAFASALGVSRQTLYDWKKSIPQFNEKVRQSRIRLGGETRLQKVYNGLYLKASAGVPEAVKLYLQIFDGWQPPSQKHEVKVGGLGDLVNQARQKNIIEGEVVDNGH